MGLNVTFGVAFALAGNLWLAIPAFLLAGVMTGVYRPLYDTWLNQGLDSAARATVLSIASQADALGQVAGGPALGAYANVAGVRPALVATMLLRLPVIALLLLGSRWARRGAGVVVAEG